MIKHLVTAALIALLAPFSADARPRYGVKFHYFPPASKAWNLTILHKTLSNSQLLESEVDLVGQRFRLPRDIPVHVKECGTENATYDPARMLITLCYEICDNAIQSFYRQHEIKTGEHPGDEQVKKIMTRGYDVLTFVLYHELAHAFIHQLKLPIAGREEDAADQLSTVVLLRRADGAEILSSVALHFSRLAAQQNSSDQQAGIKLPFWSEHSLDQQRMYSIICLVYGSNPARFTGLVGGQGLPPERALSCPREYERAAWSWNQLLLPHAG